MSQKFQQGNVIEFVIIGILVLTIVGLLAWRFLGTSEKSDRNTTTQPSTSQVPDTTPTTPELGYEGVRTTSKKGAFSVVIPNGWKMVNIINDDQISSGPVLANIQYNEAQAPQITDKEGFGWDGYTEFFYVLMPVSSNPPQGSCEQITLNDGTKATKCARVDLKGTTSEAYGALEDNYTTYAYVITKEDTVYMAYFGIYEKTQYDRSLIDNVVKSIEIN